MKKIVLLLCGLLLLAVPARAGNFIADESIPKSLIFLPAPPEEGSPAFELDKATYLVTRELRGSARWKQATFDADIDRNWTNFYKDAIGFSISKKKTPAIYALISEIKDELSDSTSTAKVHYNRVRPYVYFDHNKLTCYPGDEKRLSHNGSFPSGHTTYGWGVALVLSEIVPEKKDDILKRGYEYGQSRVICGYHWQSDVNAGYIVGSAVVSQLHNSPEFLKMLDEAKKEAATLTGAK